MHATDTVPMRSADVIYRRIGSELLTFDQKTHHNHVLNAAAAVIFESATGATTLETVAQKLAETFEIDPGQALQDTQETIAGMQSIGLLASAGVEKSKYVKPAVRRITTEEIDTSIAEGAEFPARSLVG